MKTKLVIFAIICAAGSAVATPKITPTTTASHKTPANLKTSGAIIQGQVAIFSGGCFWCMQPPFDALKSKGVTKVVVGYEGGTKDHPTYEEVSAGTTGHRESVQVTYNPAKISYKKLLDVYWHNIDPYDPKGEFCDDGEQYTSAVFYTTEDQKKIFEKTEAKFIGEAKIKGTVTTKLLPAKPFWPAENYHQEYYKKNPIRYHFYRAACGRDRRLKQVWGKSSE